MATYQDIIDALGQTTPELTNTSAASVFRRMAYVFAQVIDTVKNEIASTQTKIQEYIDKNRFGKAEYYIQAAKAFQYGDTLLKDEYYRPYYETINPTKQIIAQASLYVETTQVEIGGKNYPITSLILKVAGKDSNGKLSKLSEVQKTAFDTYMTNFEIPGIPLSKYSLAPNILGFSAGKCVYSPQYNQESIADAVTQAMEAFRDQITFDSTLYISRLQQYVMNNVPGVIGFSLSGTTLDSSAFTESVIMSAGYFDYIDNFENLIEYVPGN